MFGFLYMHLNTAFQAVRCQVLEYFVRQREGLREDHVLFSFEQSMTFSQAEFALTNQVRSDVTKPAHCSAITPLNPCDTGEPCCFSAFRHILFTSDRETVLLLPRSSRGTLFRFEESATSPHLSRMVEEMRGCFSDRPPYVSAAFGASASNRWLAFFSEVRHTDVLPEIRIPQVALCPRRFSDTMYLLSFVLYRLV